ncbi:hypothetical protein [Allobaculum sp. Allo2]|uniref:hypothetical protein n=1 Tax=Allobaculum sp. Allo2 TaxID=2853432 RepID=UPI001F5FFF7C|nr:hypothetical protein [Allobaculum sp. Allo2]UNT93453.1 hypothetical protein KWG61_01110 [Allobaculum sp. Allo2]
MISRILQQLSDNPLLLRLIRRSLSMGVFHKELQSTLGQGGLDLANRFEAKARECGVKFENAQLVYFMILELTGSVCYSSIVYGIPCSIEELKPVLFDTIRAILASAKEPAGGPPALVPALIPALTIENTRTPCAESIQKEIRSSKLLKMDLLFPFCSWLFHRFPVNRVSPSLRSLERVNAANKSSASAFSRFLHQSPLSYFCFLLQSRRMRDFSEMAFSAIEGSGGS